MECLFFPELNENLREIELSDEEFLHAKALRIKIDEQIIITNGKGLSNISSLIDFTKKSMTFSCGEFINSYGESKIKIGLAMGILHNKDRFEFAIEKAVELGVSDFYPLILKNNQVNSIKIDRLFQKSISAMKQSKRSVIMKIHEPMNLDIFSNQFHNYDNIFVLDEFGNKIANEIKGSFLVVVGPEGGLEKNEIEYLLSKKAHSISLVDRRLRSETAAIMGLSVLINSIV